MGFILHLSLIASAGATSGAAVVTNPRQQVQEKVEMEWVYTVGPDGLSMGDELVIDDPVFHGMRWSKWGELSPFWQLCTEPSTEERASWGMITAQAYRKDAVIKDATVTVVRDNCDKSPESCTADIHEEVSSRIYLDEGELQPWDTIVVKYGDEQACLDQCAVSVEKVDCKEQCARCGWETPNRAFSHVEWESWECLDGKTCEALEPAYLEFSANPNVRGIYVHGPSIVQVGDAFDLKATLLDLWGNPIASISRELVVSLEGATGLGDGDSHTYTPKDGGWHDFTVRLDEPGIHRIKVEDTSGGVVGFSNPIEVVKDAPTMHRYFGDIHVHHGYTYLEDGKIPRDVNHDYARDALGLDIVAESVKAQGIEIDELELWDELVDNCTNHTVEGDYLVLLAFEWIGSVAKRAFGTPSDGHHNVYYNTCDGPYGTHDVDVIPGVTSLWDWVDHELAKNPGLDAVTIPHATRFTGYNFDVGDPQLQRLAEVTSGWGDDTIWVAPGKKGKGDNDGSIVDMIRRGHRVGFMASSDNHDGWMGNPYAKTALATGLAAFLAPELTREAVFESMKNRHTYATTGHRPIVGFQVTDGGKTYEQGTELIAYSPVIDWRYHATDVIKSIKIYSIELDPEADREVIHQELEPPNLDNERTLEWEWDGKDRAVWLEVLQEDQGKAWSSPIWLTTDCKRMDAGAVDPNYLCGTPDSGDSGGDSTVMPDDTGADSGPQDSGEDTDDEPPGKKKCNGCAAKPGASVVWLGALAAVATTRRRHAR